MSSIERGFQQQQQQRIDKKHRKLVRSPEKLSSPCDYDSYSINNPSRLSASTNVFSTNPIPPFSSKYHRSSPTKSYNDQFPPPSATQQQQVWLEQQQSHHLITIPPSSSAPSIALHRKPSITIKYSKDEDIHHHHHHHHHNPSQQLSKNESNADQMSNNNDNFFINFNDQQQNLSPFNYDEFISSNCDIYHHHSLSTSSPTSASLNLDAASDHHIVFHSNNPFLSDNFDAITSSCDAGSGVNFFNVDDSNDSELLFIPDDELTMTTATVRTNELPASLSSTTVLRNDGLETQLLRNKREKFSNASPTMKFCLLVVSPPSNKLLQVSCLRLLLLLRFAIFVGITLTRCKSQFLFFLASKTL